MFCTVHKSLLVSRLQTRFFSRPSRRPACSKLQGSDSQCSDCLMLTSLDCCCSDAPHQRVCLALHRRCSTSADLYMGLCESVQYVPHALFRHSCRHFLHCKLLFPIPVLLTVCCTSITLTNTRFQIEVFCQCFTGSFDSSETYVDELNVILVRTVWSRSFWFDFATSMPWSFIDLQALRVCYLSPFTTCRQCTITRKKWQIFFQACHNHGTAVTLNSQERFLRIVKVLRILKIIRILRTFKAIEWVPDLLSNETVLLKCAAEPTWLSLFFWLLCAQNDWRLCCGLFRILLVQNDSASHNCGVQCPLFCLRFLPDQNQLRPQPWRRRSILQ